jgi:hypothetical protein
MQLRYIIGGHIEVTVEGVFVNGTKLSEQQLADLLPRLKAINENHPNGNHAQRIARSRSIIAHQSLDALQAALRRQFNARSAHIARDGHVSIVDSKGIWQMLSEPEIIEFTGAFAATA